MDDTNLLQRDLTLLKNKVVAGTALPPPSNIRAPEGQPEAVREAYKAGYAAGWIGYRQTLKKFFFGGG